MDDGMKDRIRLFQMRVMATIALIVTFGFFGAIYAVMTLDMPQASHEVLLVMLGSLGTAWSGIIAFYYGSSSGSHIKDIVDKPLTKEPTP